MISFDRNLVKKFIEHLMKKYDVRKLMGEAKRVIRALDWNPFKLDDPVKFETAWDETKNNFILIGGFIKKIVDMVELAVEDLEEALSGPEKLEVAVQFLDDVIRLPFYLEWLDKPILRLLLSLIVTQLNDERGHTWDETVMRETVSSDLA